MTKMKIIIIIFSAFITPFVVAAQDQLTLNFLARTYMLKYGKGTASGFLIRHNTIDYLVTAKHIFGNNDKQDLLVSTDKGWHKIEGKIYYHTNKQIDIAVIKVSNMSYDKEGIELEDYNVALGEWTYFLGFPYGFSTEDNSNINEGFPMPFIKRAALSSMITKDSSITLILDGHNNPGFSGGPVIIRNLKTNKLAIVGVISGYIPQTNKLITPVGTWNYFENSGIIIAYGTKHVIEIINEIR